MDAPDSGSRHSRPSSAPNSEHAQSSLGYQPYLHDRASMASTNLMNPGNAYPTQPSYQTGYPQPASQMMPSTDSRKAAEAPPDTDPALRQSLPSISEVISGSGAKPSHYPPPPANSQQNSSFPSHFSQNPPRSYPELEKLSGSQSVHSAAYPSRQEALSSYSGSPRQSYASRPGMPGVGDRRMSPSAKHELPHGQYPLPYYPPSPKSGAQHMGFDQRGQPMFDDFDRSGRMAYGQDSHRYYEAWTYQDALNRLGQSSRTLYNFAEAYLRIASEQHGAHPIPERLPTEQEVNDMIAHADQVKYALEQLRDMVQQSLRSERTRDGPPKGKGPYDEDQDMTLYGDMKPHYGMTTEVKKRRGRAAPPGRCHSCNRIDTPEWRRGPDGARTLCNACGLHYAKLERKRQLEARSLRPKPDGT